MVAIPKKAATVILLRGRSPDGFEVFLLKRHEKSSFMGGKFVYPGGRVDRDDGAYEICPRCKGLTPDEAYRAFGRSIPEEESFAHWIAGIRELFEESGILLAYDQTGHLLHLEDQTEGERFSHLQSSLQKGELTLCQLAEKETLLLALDQLHYYAHWITPEARPERFDTRFFIARQPEGQEARCDQQETTAGVWLTPEKALEENLKGTVLLSPPTLKTVEDLSRFKRMDDLFASLEEKEIKPVLPVLTRLLGETLILLPWDPDYDTYRRGQVPDPIDHGRPSQPRDNTTRLFFRDSRWLPYCRVLDIHL